MNKKKDLEDNQNHILEKLNVDLQVKDEEMNKLKRYINQIEREISSSGGIHTSHENDKLR